MLRVEVTQTLLLGEPADGFVVLSANRQMHGPPLIVILLLRKSMVVMTEIT